MPNPACISTEGMKNWKTENTKTIGQDINNNLNDRILNFKMSSKDPPVQDETSGIEG